MLITNYLILYTIFIIPNKERTKMWINSNSRIKNERTDEQKNR